MGSLISKSRLIFYGFRAWAFCFLRLLPVAWVHGRFVSYGCSPWLGCMGILILAAPPHGLGAWVFCSLNWDLHFLLTIVEFGYRDELR
jgi:hypothetical protein